MYRGPGIVPVYDYPDRTTSALVPERDALCGFV